MTHDVLQTKELHLGNGYLDFEIAIMNSMTHLIHSMIHLILCKINELCGFLKDRLLDITSDAMAIVYYRASFTNKGITS